MPKTLQPKEIIPPILLFGEYELHLPLGFDPTDREQFYRFCEANHPLGMERTPEGRVAVTMPTGGRTGNRNALLNYQLVGWALQEGSGVAFDSNTGFELPNGAMRAPEAAWVKKARLAAIPEAEREKFLPLAPDFVVELRSDSDRLAVLQSKMEEYQHCDVALALLIDPAQHRVHLYRPNSPALVLDNPTSVDCSPELPGLVLDLTRLFQPEL